MANALNELAEFLEHRDRPTAEITDTEILGALLEWIDSRSWPTFSVTCHADGSITRIDHSAQ